MPEKFIVPKTEQPKRNETQERLEAVSGAGESAFRDAGDSSLQSLELKANLNPEQREYLEVLKDKMKKVLGHKTKQELAKAGDLTSLKNYKAVLEDILEFLRTKETKEIKFQAKAVEYLEKLLVNHADERYIALALAGLDSDQAWNLREKILARARSGDIPYLVHVSDGLAGLDSKKAWDLRARLREQGADIGKSLIGLDSEKAWQWRQELLEQGTDKWSIAFSLAGLDSAQAWEMRDKLLERGAHKNALVCSLAGLDSEKAWKIREEFLEDKDETNKLYNLAESLIGLDSDRAWSMREKLLEKGFEKQFIVRFLGGLDSEKDWTLREELKMQISKNDYVAKSLAGLDSERAWDMRAEFIEQEVDLGDIALGVYGDYLMEAVRKARKDELFRS